jgi:hypothetical protein
MELQHKRVVAVFAVNRPDEERQVVPEWIKAKQVVSPGHRGNNEASKKERLAKRSDENLATSP